MARKDKRTVGDEELDGGVVAEGVGEGEEVEPDNEEDEDSFRRINPIDGERFYFKASPGATARGILLGRFQRTDSKEDKIQFYYQLQLAKDCSSATTGDGKQATAQRGQILQIDERSGLRDLIPLAEKTEKQEVIIRSVEKIKLKRSAGSFWRWDVLAKEAPRSLITALGAPF